MSAIKWYKRDPNAALTGMMVLTLEERGAYNTILDLIYTHGGRVLNDDRFLSGWMRCDLRVWRRIKSRLLDLNKLYVDGEFLRNSAADKAVGDALHRIECARDAGQASAAKRLGQSSDNSDLAPTAVERPPELPTSKVTTKSSSLEDKSSSLPSSGASGFEKCFSTGLDLFPHLAAKDSSIIRSWLNGGCDPELDVIPTLKRYEGRRDIGSWNYFTNPVTKAMNDRTAPLPDIPAGPKPPSLPELSQEERDAKRADTIRWAKKNGVTTTSIGPQDYKWLEEYERKERGGPHAPE
jgi:uncharacterized protein YdaU (DUF1376 family)